MKKINLVIIALLAFTACKKENTNTSKGTIVLTAGPNIGQAFSDNNYSAQDSVTIVGLMAANNLSTSGFSFYAYQSYNALDQNNQMGFYQLATATQIRNGLPVFFENITFPFENGKFNEPYPAPQFIVGIITLDNKPNLSLSALRNTFINLDNTRESQNISIGDSTLVAQLGYYNLNIEQMPAGGTPNYIKAWYVHPKHWLLPQGYFRDDNGVAISFDPLTHTGPIVP